MKSPEQWAKYLFWVVSGGAVDEEDLVGVLKEAMDQAEEKGRRDGIQYAACKVHDLVHKIEDENGL